MQTVKISACHGNQLGTEPWPGGGERSVRS